MNILVSNDDGIYRRGIQELASALSLVKGAKIYVFAPDRERTAAGHGITMRDSICIEAWDKRDYPDAQQAFSCSGTPADCVKIGVALLKEQGISVDLVCSGINHGSNLGTDFYYSGTVACAMEGRLLGIPSIAFSLCSSESTHFEVFRDLVPEIVNKSFGKIPDDTFLNVNVPNLPKDKLAGIIVTSMETKEYTDIYKPVQVSKSATYYESQWTDSHRSKVGAANDVGGVQAGYVTIVPVSITKTEPEKIDLVKTWGIQL
ncbi:MAG: 5'/3'-nucleotidase SurE [Clostridia bacterium]|nr:5'/3'-nucleotidase SurE [Clostridia bacterium]